MNDWRAHCSIPSAAAKLFRRDTVISAREDAAQAVLPRAFSVPALTRDPASIWLLRENVQTSWEIRYAHSSFTEMETKSDWNMSKSAGPVPSQRAHPVPGWGTALTAFSHHPTRSTARDTRQCWAHGEIRADGWPGWPAGPDNTRDPGARMWGASMWWEEMLPETTTAHLPLPRGQEARSEPRFLLWEHSHLPEQKLLPQKKAGKWPHTFRSLYQASWPTHLLLSHSPWSIALVSTQWAWVCLVVYSLPLCHFTPTSSRHLLVLWCSSLQPFVGVIFKRRRWLSFIILKTFLQLEKLWKVQKEKRCSIILSDKRRRKKKPRRLLPELCFHLF